MKLHYSQTNIMTLRVVGVSVPYEITLLSNYYRGFPFRLLVSVPYEITLLSNKSFICKKSNGFQYLMKLHYSQTNMGGCRSAPPVSVPYEITLLSNLRAI